MRRKIVNQINAGLSGAWADFSDAIATVNGLRPAPPNRQPRRLALLFYNDVETVTDTRDFVENLLRDGELSIIFGPSNVGKTFVAMDLAMSVATGTPFAGREVEQGGVVYCALEGGDGVRNRISAYRKEKG